MPHIGNEPIDISLIDSTLSDEQKIKAIGAFTRLRKLWQDLCSVEGITSIATDERFFQKNPRKLRGAIDYHARKEGQAGDTGFTASFTLHFDVDSKRDRLWKYETSGNQSTAVFSGDGRDEYEGIAAIAVDLLSGPFVYLAKSSDVQFRMLLHNFYSIRSEIDAPYCFASNGKITGDGTAPPEFCFSENFLEEIRFPIIKNRPSAGMKYDKHVNIDGFYFPREMSFYLKEGESKNDIFSLTLDDVKMG